MIKNTGSIQNNFTIDIEKTDKRMGTNEAMAGKLAALQLSLLQIHISALIVFPFSSGIS